MSTSDNPMMSPVLADSSILKPMYRFTCMSISARTPETRWLCVFFVYVGEWVGGWVCQHFEANLLLYLHVYLCPHHRNSLAVRVFLCMLVSGWVCQQFEADTPLYLHACLY